MTSSSLNPNLWVEKYSDYLFNYTITRVNELEVAKDLVQETFFAGIKSMKNFKGEASERTWLVSILKRKIIDHYRRVNSNKGKAEVRMNYVNEDGNEGDWLEEKVADPFDQTADKELENNELGVAIHRCISSLPVKQARIFKLKTIDQFETEAICKEFNITASNLWVIIHRARTSMVQCLEKNWF